jgi:hypothetical protein
VSVEASGWFKDPYGRHEARWISDGSPTRLVRDGTVEGTDIPPEPLGDRPLVPVEDPNAATDGSDFRRANDAERKPEVDVDRYRTMAFDTMARPPLFPVPGGEGEYDRPRASRRRLHGFWLMLLGVVAIVGGLLLIQVPPLPTHHFVPSSRELAVLRVGGTAIPSNCPDDIENSERSSLDGADGLLVKSRDADTQFTVYPHGIILLSGPVTPEISTSAPICQLTSSDVGEYVEDSYYLERPGSVTVYFISSTGVSVVRVVATASSPPSILPGQVLIALGVLAIVAGLVLSFRRHRDSGPGDDLRRADDGGRGQGFDAQAAQRAAWDALDQSAGQY